MAVMENPGDPGPTSRDLNGLSANGLPERVFPLPTEQRKPHVQVVVRQSVLNEIHRHGRSQTSVEVCGVLVGEVYRDTIGPFVYVEASVRGEHAGNQMAQVTFTAETWNHIQAVLDRDHPHLRIVGWYHTHPGFGIFLSPMDLFIHENFFNHPEQLALVYDPLRGDEGVFLWREGKPTREAVSIEDDEPQESIKMVIRISELPAATAAAEGGVAADRIDRLERRVRRLWLSVGILAIVAVIWPIALHYLPLPAFKTERNTEPDPSKFPSRGPEDLPPKPSKPGRHIPVPAQEPPPEETNKTDDQATEPAK